MIQGNPVCRSLLMCPCCGDVKGVGLVMCWPCWHAGKYSAELSGYQEKALAAAEAAFEPAFEVGEGC